MKAYIANIQFTDTYIPQQVNFDLGNIRRYPIAQFPLFVYARSTSTKIFHPFITYLPYNYSYKTIHFYCMDLLRNILNL